VKRIYIETFGCQMNEYDTEIIKSILQNDYTFVDSFENADIVLLNTCSVRDNADRKIFARIHHIKHLNRSARIGVLGCMATAFKEDLLRDTKKPIDLIAGPDSYKQLAHMLQEMDVRHHKAFDVTLSEFETYSDIYPSREKGVNAWIAIMRGCNNFCAFCVVPYARGRERSRSPESIVQEAERLVSEGYPQVTLLGQNVNSYSYDGHDFPYLLERMCRIQGLERIRFTSPHPKDFPERLLHVIAENSHMCKHIHLPLQAGNDRILRFMKRRYRQKEYLALVDKIREYIPDVALTTDIIVGFPTETEEEFRDTVKVMEQVRFDSAFIFKYSQRPGTLAARRYPDDVPADVKTDRITRLVGLQKQISLQKNRESIGQILTVLIEQEQTKKSREDMQGRSDGNKLVILPYGPYRLGQFVRVKITGASAHVLKGEVIS
jgi:tRNA-2-methylthio-N6-dimethylallyladenosine synthase